MERYELRRKTYSIGYRYKQQKTFTLHRVTKSFGALGIQEGVNNLTQGAADVSRNVVSSGMGVVGNVADKAGDIAKNAVNTGLDATKNVAAGAVSTTGSVLNAVAKPIGTALQVASIPFGPLGWAASTAVKKGAMAVGKGLEKTGDNMAG